MTYEIVISRKAKRKLQSLDAQDRIRIVEKIMLLRDEIETPNLDIKPIVGEPPLQPLRVGNWRIIFWRDGSLKIVTVEKIKPRGDAYK